MNDGQEDAACALGVFLTRRALAGPMAAIAAAVLCRRRRVAIGGDDDVAPAVPLDVLRDEGTVIRGDEPEIHQHVGVLRPLAQNDRLASAVRVRKEMPFVGLQPLELYVAEGRVELAVGALHPPGAALRAIGAVAVLRLGAARSVYALVDVDFAGRAPFRMRWQADRCHHDADLSGRRVRRRVLGRAGRDTRRSASPHRPGRVGRRRGRDQH
jgi:hypothetical protein